jgi:hypothetical protein
MTNNIYPPDHLLRKWEELIIDEEQNVDVVLYEAFQAGADQELEACSQWIHGWYGNGSREVVGNLYAARRPKPPSLKEQALALISHDPENQPFLSEKGIAIIRRALESLPD